MPGSSNSSFIPKHTSNKAERKNTPRQLFIGTILVRVFFFAVLIASVGVFAYERKLSSELSTEIDAFKTATQAFESEEKNVQAVLSMDKRLIQAKDRFMNSLSFVALLDVLDKTTIRTVELDSLEIEKKSDTEITMTAEVVTDNFDSVMFQRSVYEANDLLKITQFEEVTVSEGGATAGAVTPASLSISVANPTESTVTFKATMAIDPKLIPVVMERASITSPDSGAVINTSSETATTTSTSTDVSLAPNSDSV